MAGVGFKLRKLLKRGDYLGLVQAYSVAGILGAGPWLLSTFGLLGVGILSMKVLDTREFVVRFLVSITYLMAGSMILTGLLQLMFTRFLSDRVYDGDTERILPNFFGALLVTTLLAGLLGFFFITKFENETFLYKLLMLGSFVTLSDIWMTVVFVSGMRNYRWVLWAFFIGYLTTILVSCALTYYGLEGLLTGFLLGHTILFFMLLILIIKNNPGEGLISFDFLKRRQCFYSLAVIGLLYNLGMWIDRFIFWMHPQTGETVVGPLRFSIIYDYPLFLASLSVIPGLAVFLLKVETDFAEKCADFYRAILDGKTLEDIQNHKRDMVAAARESLFEIVKVQGLVAACLIFIGPSVLRFMNVSPYSIYLFKVACVGFALFMLVLSLLNVLFYLDKRIVSMLLAFFYFITNATFSYITQLMGPSFYGYGFALAAGLTVLLGFWILSRKFARLEYETFMLQ